MINVIVSLSHDGLRFWITTRRKTGGPSSNLFGSTRELTRPQFVQEFTSDMENIFGKPLRCPNFRFSLPLPISGSTDNLNSPPADHRTLSAAEAVPSGSPSVAHIPSTTYPSPLAATTPSAASHTPLLGPPEAAVSSGTSLTALYAVTTHPYSLNYITSPS
ncbi:uncharacterized protein LACBIDRAFT_294958 [Laccaria bicolor S238N-H82]|uniref:Predicted protein n=1 Tax=Laccaria bicolor (strain S238N-H82 / ATCC MYA-4686) TaxID=486041 RepID=B0DKH3_LACBS|nr:uncharacterized protein LACBIDRAFT_294958 [Laccaria bicolor S238N-H82]EDR04946.1 predicted protein [Laccaria bicolor S238N-H82]|eukprot:XP_001884336.1 predicted protein [Laccaria bicolor S238N-H82]